MDVKTGEFGGYVQKESNLSQLRDCWIYDDSKIYDDAQLIGNAKLKNNSTMYDSAIVFDQIKLIYESVKIKFEV